MRSKKEINIQIGERVRQAREQAKLTQEALAEKLEVSPQYVSDLERGVVGVSMTTFKKLCQILGVTSDQLLFGSDTMDRGAILANACSTLTDEQFAILTDVVDSFVKAVNT